MTDTPTPRRSRVRRAEREEHLFTARAAYTPEGGMEDAVSHGTRTFFDGYEPNEAQDQAFAPNEAPGSYAAYVPNEEPASFLHYMPNEEPDEQTSAWPEPQQEAPDPPDYAAYYSREAELPGGEAPSEFAPPPSMQYYSFEPQVQSRQAAVYPQEPNANHVYRVREATWADEEREGVLTESELGYQVSEEPQPERRKRHTLRNGLIVLAVLLLLCAGIWLLREPLMQLVGVELFAPEATEEPFAAVVTPEPVKAYDAAPAPALPDAARVAIAQLSGTMNMEHYIVTEQHIVTRHQRQNGTFDFYLFTAAEGRLLCYFEGLNSLDLIPLEDGGFHVKQSPWLISPNGSAMIRTADIEAALNESVFLHPMYRGWAVVESEEDGHTNYVNSSGQLMSSLWFSRAFPFTGEYTLAYVDTGSAAAAENRYLLYVIAQDGSMSRWLAAGDMQDAVAAVNGMAYMSDGSVYRLPDTSAPVFVSSEIIAYPDCDAMVVRDEASGKYGLFVRGEQHYDYAYDSIHPLESDMEWAEKSLGSGSAVITLRAVSGAAYPQPLSHSFVLEKDGVKEYVALSANTSCPILLDGEF